MPLNFFFQEGSDCDERYELVRDCSEYTEYKNHIEDLWGKYQGYADSNFREDAKNHFFQRYWEMYLAVTLLERKIKLVKKPSNEGPDICALIDGKRVWFEAIAPTEGEGEDSVPIPENGKVYSIEPDRIALRFTSALSNKKEQFNNASKKGIIKPDDGYVLAVNSKLIPHGSDIDIVPIFLRGFLPLGNLTLTYDKTTSKFDNDLHYNFQPKITKSGGAEVLTDNFLREEYIYCSAVLHSAANWGFPQEPLGVDFSILHNPKANYPLSEKKFSWCEQFKVNDCESNIEIVRIRSFD